MRFTSTRDRARSLPQYIPVKESLGVHKRNVYRKNKLGLYYGKKKDKYPPE